MAYPWCVMLAPEVQGQTRGAVLGDARWKKHTAITFAFLDGEPDLQDRVAAVAQEWITRTGIALSLRRMNDPAEAAVRVSFKYIGSWSMVGHYCTLETNASKPTMNFGWLHPDSTEEEVREVVLHEFGHALGFIHEHQNPHGGLRWKREAVIEALSKPPNSWDLAKIELNVLKEYDARTLITTPFDSESIMLYPFPAEWNEQGVETRSNSDLSPQDIELARRIYK